MRRVREEKTAVPARIAALAILVATTVAFAPAHGQPASEAGPDAGRDPVLARAVDGFVVPAFARFRADARRLSRAVVRHCVRPSEIAARRVAEAFAETAHAFGRVSVLRFGPAVETLEFDRLGTPVTSASFVRAEVDALIAGSGIVAEPRDIAELTASAFAFQGLPALERVLGLDAADGPPPALAPRRCRLARLIAANVALVADDLHVDWAEGDGFPATFVRPGPDNPRYRSRRAVGIDVLEFALSGVGALQAELAPLAEAAAPAASFTDARTFAVHGHQAAFLRGKAEGVMALLSEEAFGPLLVDPTGDVLVEVRDRLARTVRLLTAVEEPARRARGKPDDLAEAVAHVAAVRGRVAEDLAPAAALRVPEYRELLR